MDRRGRRVALLLAGAVGLTAAVVLLRQTQETGGTQENSAPLPTIAVLPTTVPRLADDGVVLPEPGERPGSVGQVQVRSGDRTLRLRWGQAVTGVTPSGAAGYDVRWGRPGALDNRMLVAASEVELRGLDNGERYDVEVRSVDGFGRHSEPTTGDGTPERREADPLRGALTGLYDNFSGDDAPNPQLWAVHRGGSRCLRAGAGTEQEDDRLVLDLRCGSSEGVLRARVPLRLDQGTVLGRVVVVTDGPIPGGALSIALVPGPVTSLGVGAGSRQPSTGPGVAVEDPALPPGTIRAVVTAEGAHITAGPGTPRTTSPAPTDELTPVLGSPGVTARWDLQLTTNGVTLRRDDELAASGDVVPGWTEATVLVGFSASPGDSARLHVDAIGFSGAASTPPNVVDLPGVLAGDVAAPPPSPDREHPRRPPLDAAPDAVSAQLQVTATETPVCLPGDLTADFGNGLVLPLAPPVPGAAPPTGPACPLAAELTPELLALLRDGTLTPPLVRSTSGAGVAVGGTLAVTYPPGLTVRRSPATDPPGPPPRGDRHRIAHLSAELRNAAGAELVQGSPVPRGRTVLQVTLDGLAGQRETGQLGGVAGLEVHLDRVLIAGLPTVGDGPAPAGVYRFGLSAARLSPGSHVLEVRVLGSESGARPRTFSLSFEVAG
ncbi:MAG TPA: hypothetical protein VGD67_16670 [Pseudonocardiaceae bacterium]